MPAAAPRRNPPRLLFLLLLLSLAMTSRNAHADGMFVWRNRDVDILEPEQKALILHDRGWEDLVLEVKYRGEARDFGWIVPVPSNPTLSPGEEKLFETLSRVTQNEEPAHAPNPATMGVDRAVTVLQESRVGIYDTATLSSNSGAALAEWLGSHGYAVEPRAQSILDGYAAKGWLFVAMRITVPDSVAQNKLHEGTIQPIRLRFAATEPVFPLGVSAASGHPSEILLYVITHTAVRPGPDQLALWSSRYCRRVDDRLWGSVVPDSQYAALRLQGALLTKLRATVSAEQMRDVTFAPLPALDQLASPDTLQRARAASILGDSRDTSAVSTLISFVRRPGRTVIELRAGIWALGQIGTPEAIQEVVRWIGDGRSALSRDAILTLESAGSRAGIDACLALRGRKPAERSIEAMTFDDPRDPALGYLLKVLRPSDLDLVNAKLPPSTGLSRGERWSPPQLGGEDLIRLALGDPKTTDWVCDSLVAQGVITRDVMNERMNGSSVNGFPSGFWTGAAVAIGTPGLSMNWTLLDDVLSKLYEFPQRRETILHRIAKDSRLPEAGRVIVISYLKAPLPADWEYLRRIWKSARGGEDTQIQVRMRFLGRSEGVVEYPARACLAAYALGQLRGVSDLLKMWAEVRGAGPDDVLRGDVAFALALTDSAPAIEPVIEYLRTTWAPQFSKPRMINWGREQKPPKADIYSEIGLDFDYRRGVVNIVSMRGDTRQLAGLFEDASLPPYFRLFWIAHGGLFRKEQVALVPLAYAAIKQIESSAQSDSLLLQACGDARRMVDSAVAIREGKLRF